MIEPVEARVGVVPVRTPTLPPATHTNVWVLGDRRVTVVDPASPYEDEQGRLLAALDGVEVERIVLTHHHPDHVAGAWALQRALAARGRAAPIVAHAVTAAWIGVAVDQTVGEGDALHVDGVDWTVHHTPGHAPGHVVLHQPGAGVIVAGDMVAGVGTILIGPDDGDLGQYLASLDRLQALGADRLLPAHGPALQHAGVVLGMYVAHRHQRTEQVRQALHRLGHAGPFELVPQVYPELAPEAAPIAALQIFAHLRWMGAHGLAAEEGGGWRLT